MSLLLTIPRTARRLHKHGTIEPRNRVNLLRFSPCNVRVSNKVEADYVLVNVSIPSPDSAARVVAEPRILPTREKHFRSGLERSSPRTEAAVGIAVATHPGRPAMEPATFCSHRYARLALWTTFLLCALQLNASDANPSCTVYTGAESSNSAPSTAQNTP